MTHISIADHSVSLLTSVVVLFEPGPAGREAIDLGRALAQDEGADLTVVGLVPGGTGGDRCGVSPVAYRDAVTDAVARELDEARSQLGAAAQDATFKLLVEGIDPPLERWCEAGGFDLILLPARRRLLRARGHPAAARLSRLGRAEVRVIGA